MDKSNTYHTYMVNETAKLLRDAGFVVKKEHRLWYMDQGRRVDVVGYSDREIYCFEIKTYMDDVYAKTGHNFVGNYNYFVVTDDMVQQTLKYINTSEIYQYVGLYAFQDGCFECMKEPIRVPINQGVFKDIYWKILLGDVNKSDASKGLGISRKTLDRWIKDYEDLKNTRG